jgi:hypothetical protein
MPLIVPPVSSCFSSLYYELNNVTNNGYLKQDVPDQRSVNQSLVGSPVELYRLH